MRPMTASRRAPMAWDHVGSSFRRLAKRTSAERDRSVHAMDRDIALFDVGCHGLTVVEKDVRQHTRHGQTEDAKTASPDVHLKKAIDPMIGTSWNSRG